MVSREVAGAARDGEIVIAGGFLFQDARDEVFIALVEVLHLSELSAEDVETWYYVNVGCLVRLARLLKVSYKRGNCN